MSQYPDPENSASGTDNPWLTAGKTISHSQTFNVNACHDDIECSDDETNDEAHDSEHEFEPYRDIPLDNEEALPYGRSSSSRISGEHFHVRDKSWLDAIPNDAYKVYNDIHSHRDNDPHMHVNRGKSLGRGGKGIKRGIRRPVEPGLEFKAHLSEAIVAFTANELERAEIATLNALKINPEIYEAHNLLSEIHTERGHHDKALAAAWNGAHTRSRDPQTWFRVADLALEQKDQDHDVAIRSAIYCYSRIITIDKANIEARFSRAKLNRELGYKRKAILDYELVLRELPSDMTILRYLAEVHIELDQAGLALQLYLHAIHYIEDTCTNIAATLTWSDINVLAELYALESKYDDGIVCIKRLSRWLLGRKDETHWDNVVQDDREWDRTNSPRRCAVPAHIDTLHTSDAYGKGLPMELRVKLGVFRLFAESNDISEALAHFEWLEIDDNSAEPLVDVFPDLFREAANALRLRHYDAQALRFYEPLRPANPSDVQLLLDMASCYYAVGSQRAATECYDAVLAIEPQHPEAMQSLRFSGQILQATQSEYTDRDSSKYPLAQDEAAGGLDTKRPRRRKIAAIDACAEDILKLLQLRMELSTNKDSDDQVERSDWLTVTRQLVQLILASHVITIKNPQLQHTSSMSPGRIAAQKGVENPDSPSVHQGQLIDQSSEANLFDLLAVLLEYALELAKMGQSDSAYDLLLRTSTASAFSHSYDALFLIHACWSACALYLNDSKILCNVARWFMMESQLLNDSFRFYCALNRLCVTPDSSFNSGPLQKFILRQLKAIDLASDCDSARARQLKKSGKELPLVQLNVPLLTLYGHILYAGKSYPYAINYYLRALAIEPLNVSIMFFLSLAYIHWSFKRQAENRHHILLQGFAFLSEYYHCCQKSTVASHRREADYNVARAYQLLGLGHLAILYFKNCLERNLMLDDTSTKFGEYDYVEVAALALQSHLAMNDGLCAARDIGDKYLNM